MPNLNGANIQNQWLIMRSRLSYRKANTKKIHIVRFSIIKKIKNKTNSI